MHGAEMIFLFAMIAMAVFGTFLGLSLKDELSQETLDDICINLTENETAIGQVQIDGTLLCTVPSFDSTHNIIIKQGGEE